MCNKDDMKVYIKLINELTLQNEAMRHQVSIMKEMLKEDDKIIKNMDLELKEYKLNEENNTCAICRYFDKLLKCMLK